MRVLIIGGGLGGLCLAQGLVQAGVDVRIYEREPTADSRCQGFRIGLDRHGLEALQECLPRSLHALLDASTGELAGEARITDPQLREIERLDAMSDGVATDRHVLRSLLLAGLGDRIEFGKSLTGYTERADGTVCAVFADGSAAVGDLLVGADGVGSRVRRQLLPDAEIVDTNAHAVLARTPMTERFAALVPGYGTVVRGPEVTMLIGKMEFRQPPHLAAVELAPDVRLPATESYLRWSMSLPQSSSPLPTGWAAARELILGLIDGWHPDLVEMVRQADAVNSSPLTIRYAKPVSHWGTRCVTLLGDAIHVMPPSAGQGANNAFQDAARLCRVITEAHRGESVLKAGLEGYELEMLDRGFRAVAKSLARLPIFTDRATAG